MIFKLKKHFSENINRFKGFSKLENEDLIYFKEILKPNSIITDNEDLKPYNVDWMKKYLGNSKLVLIPNTTEELSSIVKYCYERKLAIVPQSGNTGLVGGSVPLYDEIIVSMKAMNKILKFDTKTSILTCEAGCILETVNNYLKNYDYEFPLDLGAKGSCLIGGNLSTNAGGKYFIKHGPLKSAVVGLEVVTGTGEILNLLSELKKDNTGYDLKQFFLGSEGTLGIITKANVIMQKLDANKQILFLRVKDYASVLKILQASKQILGKNLSAFEYMDSVSYKVSLEHLKINDPFTTFEEGNYYVVSEISSNSALDSLIEAIYTELQTQDAFLDCLLSENISTFNSFWKIRESCPVGLISLGPTLKYDMSIAPHLFEETVLKTRKFLGERGLVASYGHIGDGNMHLNIAPNKGQFESIKDDLESWIFQYIAEQNGSISAEHGIGIHKTQYLPLIKSPLSLHYFKEIKRIFDPHYILNPYKIVMPES